MHYREARANGETEKRLYGLSAWRHVYGYTAKERAALLWAEAVTRCDVSDHIYDSVAQQFSEEELIDLTLTVAAINAWNRVNIPFQETPEAN
jgi:alkylhydroperoxidase family enzyme